MGARIDSAVVGAAGEHFVLYRLHMQGLVAALAPQGTHDADIVVFSPEMSVGSMVQVKTRTRGRDGGWHMREKHERLTHPRLFYAFVDLEPREPVTFVVPSPIVAQVLARAHQAWLAAPGIAGRTHRDHPMRRILPEYAQAVPGYERPLARCITGSNGTTSRRNPIPRNGRMLSRWRDRRMTTGPVTARLRAMGALWRSPSWPSPSTDGYG